MELKHYQSVWKGCQHIRVKMDNAITNVFVNNMGENILVKCNFLAKVIAVLHRKTDVVISGTYT